MKNTLRTLFASSSLAAVAVLGMGGALPALAGDNEPMRVSVPFAFRAGKTLLPAGDYSVYSEDSNVIMIRGLHGSAILLGSATTDSIANQASISFDRDATGYCLRSVHAWGKPAATRIVEASTPAVK